MGLGERVLAARGELDEVVHAVLGEFCEALAEEAADEVLGAGEVGLENGEAEVEVWVVRVVVRCGWVCVCGGGGEVFDCFDLARRSARLDIHGALLPWLTCIRTRSIIRSISGAGHGRTSETARSATQNRVSSWWSSAADSGLVPSSRSTEARMSSMSIGRELKV